MDQARLLGLMERVAQPLRRIGLARQVSAVRRRLDKRFTPSWIDVDGLEMTGSTIGHVAHLRAWKEGREEGHMASLFKAAVAPGDVVLDIGGYLGYFTLLAARGAGPEGRVIVVEANPQSQELLQRNIERNGFADRIAIHRTAVAGAPGTATFYSDASDGSQSGLTRPDDVAGTYQVPVATIDSLLEGEPPLDVIKIDIEGGEVGALAGMQKALASAKPGLKLFIELNPEALENAGASGAALLAQLRGAGFEIDVIDEASKSLRRLAPSEGLDHHTNLYCELAPSAT
jgi:FkbM family methyltransferase